MTKNILSQNPTTGIIGLVGIDKIKLCNLYGNETLSFEEMSRAAQETDLSVKITTNKKTVISGDDFTFSFGLNGGKPFCWLEISASKRKQPNLTNLSPADVKKRMIEIQNYLLDQKIIPHGFHMDVIRVYDMEINRTIPLEEHFRDYERVICLLAKMANPHSPDAVIMPVTRTSTNALETVYMCQKSSKLQTKIYNKSLHLFENFHCSTDCDFLRCEITAKEQALATAYMVSNQAAKQNRFFYFKELTQEKLTRFYVAEVGRIFKNLDTEMKKRAELTMNFSDTMLLFFRCLAISALDQSAESTCRQLLMLIVQEERFLDYQDIFTALDSSSLDESIKCALRSGFQYILNTGDITGNRDKLLNQRKKYDELQLKLLSDHKVTVEFFQDYIMVVGNQKRVIKSIESGAAFGLDPDTVVFIAYPDGKTDYAYAYYFDKSECRYKGRPLTESEYQRYFSA